MHKASEEPRQLWEDLLSRQPETIKEVYLSLDPADQQVVLSHLHRMVTESGWQPEQRLSAKAALDTLISEEDEDTHGTH
jgi:hypothetical protein